MLSDNPFADFRAECTCVLEKAFKKLFPKIRPPSLTLAKPPSSDFGQLASSACFELAKQLGEKPAMLAERAVDAMKRYKFSLIERVEPAGGYVNFHVNFGKFAELTIESARQLDTAYGFIKVEKPLRIIVEHTSVNPLHPIHIGQARNPILGDAVARMFNSRGHTVLRHYYIDDVGRQSSVIAYGYKKLGEPEPDGKPDRFIGKIYTITSCITEINRLKKELERAKAESNTEKITATNKELDEWMTVAVDMKQRFPDDFETLVDKIGADEDPEGAIKRLNLDYEAGEKEARKLVRHVSELCLEGFKKTLSRIDVSYDSWDWESELIWNGRVSEILKELGNSPYTFSEGGVLEFDAEKAAEDYDLKSKLGLREDCKVPSLTLVRADGTTLYTTRDMAYTLWKCEKADRVINVIGMEQTLAQSQLKLAVYALGHRECAENLTHFAYNLVSLPGYRMTARMGRYIAFDDVMDEAIERAYVEVSKRSPQLPEEEKRRIAGFVGLGAVRYALAEVDPSKPVVFTWDRVLNFEKNSAPYLQYTHARACSILRKAVKPPQNPDYSLLKETVENDIVLSTAGFPEVFVEAADFRKPNSIADFAAALADRFNSFYNAFPVIKAEPKPLSDARLALVDAVRIVLRNALGIIGVVAPEKM